MRTKKTAVAAATVEKQDEDEICRQAGLQSARAIQWDGYKWSDYQIAIVRQNHHISKLEAQRDQLEARVLKLRGMINDLLDQRDEMLEALKDVARDKKTMSRLHYAFQQQIRDAIAKGSQRQSTDAHGSALCECEICLERNRAKAAKV